MAPAPAREFCVTLSKANLNSELGIEVDHTEDTRILIKGIHGGTVLAWNEAHPELQICPGDWIIEVNGLPGDVHGTARLVGEIQSGLTLKLRLSREAPLGNAAVKAAAAPERWDSSVASTATASETPKPERLPEHLVKVCRVLHGPQLQCCLGRRRAARLAAKTRALAERCRALDPGGPPERGELHGLELPRSPQQLRQLSTPWLTRALHAAGTLPWGNEVAHILSMSDMQRGDSARLTIVWMVVKYRSHSDDLHEELCVMLPPLDAERRALAWREDLQQVVFLHFFGASLPFRSPKYYYGDLSTQTGTFVLICERIPFLDRRSGGEPLAPGKIDAGLPHPLPFSMPDREEKYYALFRKAALLAAWAHTGRLGDQVGDVFESSAGSFAAGPDFDALRESDFQELWEASGLRQLMLQAWQKLFPEDLATPMYVSQLRREALDVAKSLPAIRAYLQSAGLAYTDVLCPEVSPEDAFFWREAGRMECGFLSSRSVKRGHVCECFAGLHFAPASMRIAHSKGFVRCFTDTLRESGGPALDAGEVFLQVSLHDMVRILSSILSNAKPTYLKLEPQGWEDICGREDPALSSATGRSLELRRGLATVVDGIAAWRGLDYHGVLTRWRAAVELLPLGDRLVMGWAPSICGRSACASEHCDFLCS